MKAELVERRALSGETILRIELTFAPEGPRGIHSLTIQEALNIASALLTCVHEATIRRRPPDSPGRGAPSAEEPREQARAADAAVGAPEEHRRAEEGA